MGYSNPIFQQHDSEPYFEAWGRFKEFFGYHTTNSLPDRFYFQFLFGLNKETERWMKDAIFSNLQSRSEKEVFDLLEDIAIYEYQWLLSQHNVQQHSDPLEDQIQAPIEQPLNDEPSLPEVEQEPSPKGPKECALPIILIPSQHTPRRAKKSFLPSIPSYREIPSFVDSLDTRLPILFNPTYFVAKLLRVVDYATLHGRKPLFEHLP